MNDTDNLTVTGREGMRCICFVNAEWAAVELELNYFVHHIRRHVLGALIK